MSFGEVSFKHACKFLRDHVEVRETLYLRGARAVDGGGGGSSGFDGCTSESLVELWEWLIGFVDAGCRAFPRMPCRRRHLSVSQGCPREPRRLVSTSRTSPAWSWSAPHHRRPGRSV